MLAGILRGDGGDGHIKVPADHLGDLPDRYALVGDRMQRRSGRSLVDARGEQAGRVEPMHGRPAVRPVAEVTGHTHGAGDSHQSRHEAVVAVAVIRRGKSDDR